LLSIKATHYLLADKLTKFRILSRQVDVLKSTTVVTGNDLLKELLNEKGWLCIWSSSNSFPVQIFSPVFRRNSLTRFTQESIFRPNFFRTQSCSTFGCANYRKCAREPDVIELRSVQRWDGTQSGWPVTDYDF
jgi:hypothetical protein